MNQLEIIKPLRNEEFMAIEKLCTFLTDKIKQNALVKVLQALSNLDTYSSRLTVYWQFMDNCFQGLSPITHIM